MTTTRLPAACAAAVLAGVLCSAPGLSAQIPVEIFGAGTISRPGESVFRGQFERDGATYWFFRKVRPDAEEYRIFLSRRGPDGWSEPERVAFDASDASDLYPAPSPDGRVLVFTSYRPFPDDAAGARNANLWFVERRGAGWSEPRPMRGASTPDRYDAAPWFDADGRLHFSSTSPDWSTQEERVLEAGGDLATAPWRREPLLEPFARSFEGHLVHHGTPSPDGRLMVLEVSARDGSGRPLPPDLWLSERTASGWSAPHRLPPPVSLPEVTENFVVFTPDGAYLLFVRDFATVHRVAVADLGAAR